MSQPHFEASVKMKLTLPKVGTWCRNPSFGLATKARGCKVAGLKRKEARESKGKKPGSKSKGIGRVRAKRKPGSLRKCEGV